MTVMISRAGAPASGLPVGRPRSATAHRAIVEAAVALFVEAGLEGASVEAVAARAGVGKATIYRRWRSKEDLVVDAVIQVFAEPVRPDTGSVREDLVRCARELQELMTTSPSGEVFPRMVAEVARGSVLGRLYGERVAAPRRGVLAEAIARGVQRGELPSSVDAELLVDVLVGTLLLRRIQGGLAGSSPGLAESVVDLLLAGLLADQHVAQE